jgi:putative hydrolase of the HAD superfamily
MPDRPQVIFLDAVGTLFGVRHSVGENYAFVARQFGVQVDAQHLDQAFFQHFKAAPPMAFPNLPQHQIPQAEYRWWEAIAVQTFDQVGVLEQFANFGEFFAALYAYFKTAKPWFLYPDTLPALQHWQQQGIPLGVLSNFDTRLYPVMQALGLNPYFKTITISTEVGAAKPNPAVFQAALQKHGCRPEQAWHVGDSFKEDYEGAKAVGLRAIWLKRE